jgi:hypothetical protein
MIPVASGVLPDAEEGGSRIDLARECGPGWFEFIELKLGKNCDTPLYAAIEILGHGLLYVFSRVYAEQLGYDPSNLLLSAQHISLKVLAPANSYSIGSLEEFETAINDGLRALGNRVAAEGFAIDFQFEKLPDEAAMEPTSPTDSITARKAVYQRV